MGGDAAEDEAEDEHPDGNKPSSTRTAPPIRGTRWRSSQPTAGPATAPITVARMTGMTIVDVSPSSHTSPTMTSTNPTSSHDEKPRSLSHVGAANRTVRSDAMLDDQRIPAGTDVISGSQRA